jgi:hypothetical protein
VFAVWNVSTWRKSVTKIKELSDEVSSIEGRLGDLEQRDLAAARGIGGYDVKTLAVQAEKANEVIEWKAFSWTRLFNLMEQVLPYDVRMSSIRPLFRAGRHRGELDPEAQKNAQTVPVAVEGLAKDFRAVWELQNALLGDPHFGRVFPERLQRTERGEIVFNITFLYHPDVEVEEALVAEVPEVSADDATPGPDGEAEGLPEEGSDDAAAAEGVATVTPDEPAAVVEAPDAGSTSADGGEEANPPVVAAKAPAARRNQAAASDAEQDAARAERVRHTNQVKRLLGRNPNRPRPTGAGSRQGGEQGKGKARRPPGEQAEGEPGEQAQGQPGEQAQEQPADPAQGQDEQEREPE